MNQRDEPMPTRLEGTGVEPVVRRYQLLGRLWRPERDTGTKDPMALRSRLLVLLPLISIAVNIIYAAAAAGVAEYAALTVSLTTLAVLAVVLRSAWRRGWTRAAALLYLLANVFSLSLFILINREIHSAITAWIPFIPMLAMILLDRRDGIWITVAGIVILSATALFVTYHYHDTSFADALRQTLPTLLAFTLVSLATLGVILVYVYMRDLTQEQQLRERQAKEALLRILCHDVSNNLSVIRMSALSAPLEEPQDGKTPPMHTIRQATESTIEMVNTVRSMAALEAGKLAVRLVPVDVNGLLRHLIELFQPRARQKQIDLALIPADPPVHVLAEPVYLEQTVLANLLSNAIKFTPRGKQVRVAITSDDEQVWIHVRDQGIGIPADQQEHLFDPGKHTSREGTEGEPGTGFGLPLVRQFMLHFGGDIQFTSRANGNASGTTFTIQLKRAEPTETRSAETTSGP